MRRRNRPADTILRLLSLFRLFLSLFEVVECRFEFAQQEGGAAREGERWPAFGPVTREQILQAFNSADILAGLGSGSNFQLQVGPDSRKSRREAETSLTSLLLLALAAPRCPDCETRLNSWRPQACPAAASTAQDDDKRPQTSPPSESRDKPLWSAASSQASFFVFSSDRSKACMRIGWMSMLLGYEESAPAFESAEGDARGRRARVIVPFFGCISEHAGARGRAVHRAGQRAVKECKAVRETPGFETEGDVATCAAARTQRPEGRDERAQRQDGYNSTMGSTGCSRGGSPFMKCAGTPRGAALQGWALRWGVRGGSGRGEVGVNLGAAVIQK
ncbi:hypothetical protein C8R45DRAFT_1076576 [Mycena sanguinolenta]|nr:hypothetical protein C8R45DRAFT_1076576 [Mycena sanguinolenta]